MLFVNIFMITLSLVGCFWAAYQTRKAHRHQHMNHIIGQGLDDLLNAAKLEVARNKKLVEKARVLVGKNNPGYFDPSGINSFEDPGMLATLITVIVNKFGTLRLGLTDFSAVKNEEYVSIYMDTTTQELLLSLKHSLGEDPSSLTNVMNFTGKDDGTFH
jgi:hypothetical protein